MKTYTVIRSTSGQVGCVVSDGTGTATVLRHCVYHSPTGFETGYAGSGPADLALSILADHFHATPEQVDRVMRTGFTDIKPSGAERAMLYHQPFKFRFIASRQLDPSFSYEIMGAEIDSWLGDLLHAGAA